MKYSIYQINLTDEQIDEINSSDVLPDYYVRRCATTLSPSVAAIEAASDLYEKVAVIEADDLNGVFQIGNIGPEENIERIKGMHSISVGDVIEDEDGIKCFVASFGFGVIVDATTIND